MRQTFLGAAAAVTLLAGSLAVTATAPVAGAAAPTNPVSAFDLGVQAYEYGLPLMQFERVRREETSVSCPDHLGNAPVNTFAHADKFLDPSFRDVVAPNTDTLYSISQLDLSKGPLVLSHPDMGERYYSFAMLDPYTNVVATPGAREDGPGAASIQVRWTGRPGRADPQRFSRVVTTSYRHLWVIGRTLATTLADQRRAYALMQQYSIKPLHGPAPRVPRNCPPEQPKKYPVPTSGPAFVAQLNRALADNPPPARDRPLLRQLRPYGIGAGLSPERAGLDPVTLAALYRGVSTQAALLPTTAKAEIVTTAATSKGWYEPQANIGDYGTDYHFRAVIALFGLGANTRAEAVYPAGFTDGTGVPYIATNDYRLTFTKDQLPPARYFWSLTMYDIDGYLVANPAGIYSVGPSHPPFTTRADGSVVIAIQRTRPTDPTVNWLPSPESGLFRINLRLYGPLTSVLDGSWTPPGVTNLGPGGGA